MSIHNITTYKTRGKWATSLTGEINLINKHILKAIIIDDFFQLLPLVKFHPDRQPPLQPLHVRWINKLPSNHSMEPCQKCNLSSVSHFIYIKRY